MSIIFKSASFSYENINGESVKVFDSLSLDIEEGKFTAIIGPSGSGKSTILKLIAGLVQPTDGSITIFNSTPKDFRQMGELGIMFQTADLLPWRNIMTNVNLPNEIKKTNRTSADILNLLDDVGLNGCEDKYPYELSGGMQQRVSLARALISKPKVLLLDEPLSQLDEVLRYELLSYIQKFASTNKSTTVYITHDITEAVFVAEVVYILPKPGSNNIKKLEISLQGKRTLDILNDQTLLGLVNEVRYNLKYNNGANT